MKDVLAFLDHLRTDPGYRGQIAHTARLPAREARFGELEPPLPEPLREVLADAGIAQLYTHQAEAISQVRAGRDVVVVTSTASGKTLCYNLPVLEELLRLPQARALYLFPTKALAQDQLKSLRRLMGVGGAAEPSGRDGPVGRLPGYSMPSIRAGVYDGDTPQSTRRKLRDEAQVLLTNPDMLHSGILPYHTRWARFFANLRFVVVDEVHSYRGVFGSHVANVLRRLNRLCAHYGSEPRYLCCSATIANPKELAERLTGREMALVDDDGSPKGERWFVFWNPPHRDENSLDRVSSNVEAERLMALLITSGVQTIAFGRARVVAELLYRYVRERLRLDRPRLAQAVRAYRGGYLAEERREIERQLFAGQLMGVTSTSALELGIDIGGLDAAIIVGFPGTIASTWQQAGRAGRGTEPSVVFFIAYNEPVDQFIIRRPGYILEQSPEHGVVDPENPYVLASQLGCAAAELPVREGDRRWYGEKTNAVADARADEGMLRPIGPAWYWSQPEQPSHKVGLRIASQNSVTIVEIPDAPARLTPGPSPHTSWRGVTERTSPGRGAEAGVSVPPGAAKRRRGADSVPPLHEVCAGAHAVGGGPGVRPAPNPQSRVLAQVDRISAPELVYPEAVYLHEGETYVVDRLDLSENVAYVHRAEVDYYTQAILASTIQIDAEERSRAWGPSTLHYGEVTVTWATVAFKKIQFYSTDSLGWGALDLPPQQLKTMGMWLVPTAELARQLRKEGLNPVEGLVGLRNAAVHMLPFFAMCDKMDIGGMIDSANLGRPALFLYDRYPGGVGFAERGNEQIDSLCRACLELVLDCDCAEGCPACVGIPTLRPPVHTDPDAGGAFPIPSKAAAIALLLRLMGET